MEADVDDAQDLLLMCTTADCHSFEDKVKSWLDGMLSFISTLNTTEPVSATVKAALPYQVCTCLLDSKTMHWNLFRRTFRAICCVLLSHGIGVCASPYTRKQQCGVLC